MSFLEIGKIINTHGLKGEVKVITWMDSPEEFEKLSYVLTKKAGQEIKLLIDTIKYQKNNIIVKFKEIPTIEVAESFKNAVLFVPKEELGDLPEGVYYIADLIGCEVYKEETGEKIGILTDVFSTGSNDVYEIKREGAKNLYVPIIDGVKKSVDIDAKKIVIHIPEGLEE